MHNKIAEFSLSSKKSKSIYLSYVSQPDFQTEKLAGRFFILAEIQETTKEAKKIINYITNAVNNNYYQSEKIILREKIATLKVDHIFEASLTKTNKQIAKYIEDEKLKIDLEKINLTAGIIHENNIYFANVGNNQILLVHKNDHADSEYKISNISRHIIEKPEEKISASKIFFNVISGKIPAKGSFIVANEALPEYLSENQLIEIVTMLPPISAANQIKNTLESINNYISFHGIIIKNTTINPEDLKPIPKPNLNTNESIIKLNKTENSTEELLSPTGIFSKKFSFNLINALFSGEKKSAFIKDKIFVKKNGFPVLKKITQTIKDLALFIFSLFIIIFKFITNKKLLTAIQHATTNLIASIKKLNAKNKALIGLSLIFILLFLANSYYLKTKNKKQEEVKDYENLTSLIEQKQNQVDAKLLYSNDEGAKKLFDELEILVGELPQNSTEEIEKYNKFKEKIEIQLETIRRVTRLDNLEKIADLANIKQNSNPENLLSLGDELYINDSQNKTIYIIDTKSKAITSVENNNLKITSLSRPSLSDKSIYYINSNNIIELDIASQKLNEIKISNIDLNNITSSEVYNSKLYLLEKNGEISRFNRSGDTFNSPYKWIKNTAQKIENALDLSISGDIYVLSATGEINRYSKGDLTDSVFEKIDPLLKNPEKISSPGDGEFVYVLEPDQKRLVVYDKKGQFLLQYKINTMEEVKDFVINKDDKNLYLLCNSSIYKTQLSHLKNP